jgi:Flp pilus assembly protein TadG
MYKKFRDRLRAFGHAERGVILIFTALVFPALVGFLALAIDLGLRFAQLETMQVAAESAAVNGATAVIALDDQSIRATICTNEVNATARTLGFVDGVNGVSVTQTGCSAGDYVKVTISRSLTYNFLKAFTKLMGGSYNGSIWSPSSSATARIDDNNLYCILALGHFDITEAVYMSGSTNVQSPNCGIADNSADPCSLYASGAAEINTPLSVSGGVCGNAKVTGDLDLRYARPVDDPYAKNTILQNALDSNYPSGKGSKVTGTSPISLSPGHYDVVPKGADLTLSPGTYYFDDVSVGAGAVSGTGVTLIFPKTVNFPNNNATFNITPPTTGDFAGVSLASLSKNELKFVGGNSFSGSIYLPQDTVS